MVLGYRLEEDDIRIVHDVGYKVLDSSLVGLDIMD